MFIRVDMNNSIATGHVMRCLAIADELKALGEEVVFITADNETEKLLSEKGYKYKILNTPWNDMDKELPQIIAILSKINKSKILIDSYQVTPHYLEEISKVSNTTYIDDLNLFVYPVHNLICYACYWKKFKYKEFYKDTNLFLGVDYTPLRKEFSHCERKIINKEIKNVLIISGGTDNQDVLKSILLEVLKFQFDIINVICGRYYKYYNQLKTEVAERENIFIRKQVSNMKRYFDEADLVISAGGTTLYELCACGTPTISYSIADNQLDNVHTFDEENIICYAGDARFEDIAKKIKKIKEIYSYEERCRRSILMQKYIDGFGASKIAKLLSTNI